MHHIFLIFLLSFSSFIQCMEDKEQEILLKNLHLMKAVEEDNIDKMIEMLNQKADPNYEDERPLGYARSFEAIDLLLKRGADPERCDYSIIESFLTHYLDKYDENKDLNDKLPYIKKTIKLLLEHGEDINKLSWHPLLHVWYHRNRKISKELARLLISNGADLDAESGVFVGETVREWLKERLDEDVFDFICHEDQKYKERKRIQEENKKRAEELQKSYKSTDPKLYLHSFPYHVIDEIEKMIVHEKPLSIEEVMLDDSLAPKQNNHFDEQKESKPESNNTRCLVM